MSQMMETKRMIPKVWRFVPWFLLALFQNSIASQAIDAAALAGSWRGTVAGSEVRVCFRNYSQASYYYLRHLTGIPLYMQGESPQRWLETRRDHPTGVWHLTSLDNNRLTGTWSEAENKRAVPIQLQKIEGLTKSSECGKAYWMPRIKATKVTAGDISRFGDMPFRTLSALKGEVNTIELLGSEAGITKINVQLQNWFNNDIDASFGCQENVDQQWGNDSGGLPRWQSVYATQVSIATIKAKLITLAITGGYSCGGAHPNGGTSYTTYDLDTGKNIDLLRWLKAGKRTEYSYSPPERLRKMILRKARLQSGKLNPGNPGCKELINDYEDGFTVSLRQEGLTFSTSLSYSVRACDEDVALSFAELQPFLTAEGQAAQQRIEEARSVTKPQPQSDN